MPGKELHQQVPGHQDQALPGEDLHQQVPGHQDQALPGEELHQQVPGYQDQALPGEELHQQVPGHQDNIKAWIKHKTTVIMWVVHAGGVINGGQSEEPPGRDPQPGIHAHNSKYKLV